MRVRFGFASAGASADSSSAFDAAFLRVRFGFASTIGSAFGCSVSASKSMIFSCSSSGCMLEGFRYITDIGGISTAIEFALPCIAIFSERMTSFSGIPVPP